LVGGLSEVSEEVPNLLFGGVDDLSCGGSVDGSGHVRAEFLEVVAQLVEEILGRKLRLIGHGVPCQGDNRVQAGARVSAVRSQRRI
jgi:hypothetical protein